MSLYLYAGAVAVVAAVLLVAWAVTPERETTAAVRANLATRPGASTDLRNIQLSRPAHQRLAQPALKALSRQAARLTPRDIRHHLERELALAGSDWTMEALLATKALLGITAAVLGAVLFAAKPSALSVMAIAVFTPALFVAPDLRLHFLARRRQTTIRRALPDVLDQVTVSVEAGLSFESAIARLARSGSGPMSEELSRVVQDLQLGIPRQVALDQFAARTGAEDVSHFVAAMSQAEHYGMPIAHVLRVQAAELREKRRQAAEEKAQKIGVKVVFPLVVCILPSLFVVVLGPAAIRISHLFTLIANR